MKRQVRKLDEAEVRVKFPIAGRVDGWFFRMNEVSAGAWLVEGTDLWGRQVSENGFDERELIRSCCAAAERINAEINSQNT